MIARKEEKNECLIPEVLLAMQAFKSGYKVIEPYLKEKEKDYDIIIVMGTVQGDIHDLGKNVIKIFLETLDVKIIDLGIDVPEKFIEAIENYNANILMMSSLLTTTMSEMKR
ncbi:MAG: cobalamin-dependent protein [Intestinibacter bartlettii]